MRLTLFVFLAVLFQVQANTYSQNIKVTLNLTDATIQEVFDSIESQSEIRFLFNHDKIDVYRKVSLNVENELITKVLNKVFRSSDIDFVFKNKYIILKKTTTSATKTGKEKQQKTIQGTVSDTNGNLLPGVSVLVKDTNNGTVTDFDGNYTLSCDCPEGTVLLFSYVGYNSKEMVVSTSNTINVQLSEGLLLDSVTLIGSKAKARTNVESAVPIDVLGAVELQQTAQPEITQALHFSVPSFSAQKFGINDLAPLVDPAQLRGLGSDQTLLLVNGKRRHKVSFFNGNDGVGKGQLGNDMNSVPSAAIKNVQVLRDGAAAQYGSDAIAGVINYELNDASEGGSFNMYYGSTYTTPKYDDITNAGTDGDNIYGDDPIKDGHVFNASINVGAPWGDDGFVNTTLYFSKADPTDRSGTYSHSTGWYDDTQETATGLTDEELQAANGITSLDRAVLGTADNTNGGVFINTGKSINENFTFYAFGGVQRKYIIGGVFSRSPARDDRSNLSIFPNGYNPEVPSDLLDYQVTSGFKGDLGKNWNIDVSGTHSGQILELYARNTINPSLANSPTSFYTGGLAVSQTVLNVDMVKELSDATILAFGVETRGESYQQSQGETASYIAGGIEGKDVGSSGREGFTDLSDGTWRRNNIGVFVEIDSDITESLLLTAAARFEDYSDFGSDFSWKAAGRYKFTDNISIRGSVNRSFRAPALAQTHYSNYSQISFDGSGDAVVSPTLPVRDARYKSAFGIDNLKQETSFDIAGGVTAKFGKFILTADAYVITVDDRLFIADVNASDFTEFSTSTFDAINFFTNAIDTKTTGFDLVASYKHNFSEKTNLNLSLAANFNETTIEGINVTEKLSGQITFDRTSNSSDAFIYLTEGTPRSKIIFTPTFQTGAFTFLARVSNFGEVSEPRLRYNAANDEWDDNPEGGGEPQVLSSKTVTDFTVSANVTDKLKLTGSINNLFDVYPDMLRESQVRGEVIYSRRVNQFGTNGRFVSLALNYTW